MRPDPLPSHYQLWIDTGGTFTDAIALRPDGVRLRAKVLSSGALRGCVVRRVDASRLVVDENWSAVAGLIDGFRFRLLHSEPAEGPSLTVLSYDPDTHVLELNAPLDDEAAPGTPFEVLSDEVAPLLAARLLTRTPRAGELPPVALRLATTLGTNALLERKGAPTALFINEGLGDLLQIGTQQRPELFVLDVRKPRPPYDAVVEVRGRLGADGSVVEPLVPGPIESEARELVARGIRSAAVALAHAYRNPLHEQELRACLERWGFEHVSCSSALAPRIKLLPRAQTAVVNACLSPIVGNYLDQVRTQIPRNGLLVMTSAGGLADPDEFRPKDGLLSGPAGGVAGSAAAGRRCSLSHVISFDMGGTSTDVARYDGDFEYTSEHHVGSVSIAAPALDVESVAAGGGSVCWLDGERLRVGPHSAGAAPGPACYGAGGPLTITDVNLLLGRLDPTSFEIPVRVEPARARLRELTTDLARATGVTEQPEALLEGLLDIANETMADAMRQVSLRRGFDPTDYTLVAFGGAGAQHACAVASRLDMRCVLVPPDAALLSAEGLGHATLERFGERQVLQPLEQVRERLAVEFEAMAQSADDELARARAARGDTSVRRRTLRLRFMGQESTLDVEWHPGLDVEEAFTDRYEHLYGHRPERRPIEVESMRVVVAATPPAVAVQDVVPGSQSLSTGSRQAWIDGEWTEVPTYDREALGAGCRLAGPALVFERRSATVVERDFDLTVATDGGLLLERRDGVRGTERAERPAAVRLELFTQRFFSLVREMGERLERTAVSTNVKERLDFSCALLDAGGELIVNAPHIPVHLGALGLCVRRLAETIEMGPGDVVVTNHPAYGGSHLPDVTVVTPVFEREDRGALLGYVASRAHHADIGGTRPGSMPPAATRLAEEGVVLPPDFLVRGGHPCWDAVQARLAGGPEPARAVADNLADLRAAVAANHAGAAKLRALAATHSAGTVREFMARIQAGAERKLRDALDRLADGSYRATERLDDGTPIAVHIEIEGETARIDFAGSGDVHPGNLNATPAIVRSAVIYVLRLLIEEPLPLNEGLMHAVSLAIPPGILDPPFDDDPERCPAVVGGNVETSQRVVDALIRALGLAACSQGTMNNVLFGGAGYGYYETLGGGCGAGPGFAGADGVHSHMTNTRITDVEVLEHRFPVRVERFALRTGSGGSGRYRGGDGLVRSIRFLESAEVSLLGQHRVEAPYGMEGGAPGDCGRQYVTRRRGETDELAGIDGCHVDPGDLLTVETPGGGGWGQSESG